MKIGFYSPHLCLRGTTVALFEYAKYNQEILGNESIVFYDLEDKRNDESVIGKFEDNNIETRSLLFMNTGNDYLGKVVDAEKCDAIYLIKGGKNDFYLPSTKAKRLVHVINMRSPSEAHGEVFAYSSEWMSKELSDLETPYVPYIIHLPNHNLNFRKSLNISDDAIVFGRTGGKDSWNIPFVNQAIYNILQKREDIHFIFQETPKFLEHPNIHHIQSTADNDFKVSFINSCDAMIHARQEGESFGVACGEFSIKNKPVISYAHSPEQNHLYVLGDQAIKYENIHDLEEIFLTFSKNNGKLYDAYKQFSPENVMKKFDEVFLK